jgi:hypothetical protein
MRNISEKFAERIKIHILYSIGFSENRAVYEICGKILQNQTGHRRKYNTAHSLSTPCR